MKTCKKCLVTKPVVDFPRTGGPKNYVRGECIGCRNERMRARQRANRDDAAVKNAQWRAKNKQMIKEKRRAYYLANRERCLAQSRAWQEANRERFLLQKGAWRIGMTVEQYLALLASANGMCAICGSTEVGSANKARMSVDHDHRCCPGDKSCGKCIRGVICNRCNTGLARFDDDPDRLLAAAAYLLQSRNVLDPVLL